MLKNSKQASSLLHQILTMSKDLRVVGHFLSIPQFHNGCKLRAVNSLYVHAVAGSGAFPHLYRRFWLRGVPPSLLTIVVECIVLSHLGPLSGGPAFFLVWLASWAFCRSLMLAHLQGVCDHGQPRLNVLLARDAGMRTLLPLPHQVVSPFRNS